MPRFSGNKISLKQIAEAAGVSAMTVSFALRNSPQVSLATRQRIGRIARKLGYRPDPEIARYMEYLRRSRDAKVFKAIIGFLNFQNNPDAFHGGGFYTACLEGARERATELGYRLEEIWAGDPRISPKRLRTILESRGIDSIVLPPLPGDSVHLALDCSRFFASAIAFTLESPRLPRVSHDHFEGARLALAEAEKLGYRRPGFISTQFSHARVHQRWLGGYDAALATRPLRDRPPPALVSTLDAPSLARWLKRARPDVVLTPHPEVHRLLQELGHRVPDDVGLILLDHAAGDPSWAGIDQHVRQLGRSAIDVIVAARNRNEPGVPDFARTVMIEGNWRAGSTVRAQR